MLDRLLRPAKDRLLLGPARLLAGVHPNWITALSLAVGLTAAWAAWSGLFRVALLAWLANRTLDGLDGLVARLDERATDLGGYLDLLADFLVYALIPLALAHAPGAPPDLGEAAALLLASFYVNACSWMALSAVLEKEGRGAATRGEVTTVTMPEGLVAGSETVLFYSLFLLFPAYQTALFLLMAVLVAGSALQRAVWAIRNLG